jgi:hypothetical protein
MAGHPWVQLDSLISFGVSDPFLNGIGTLIRFLFQELDGLRQQGRRPPQVVRPAFFRGFPKCRHYVAGPHAEQQRDLLRGIMGTRAVIADLVSRGSAYSDATVAKLSQGRSASTAALFGTHRAVATNIASTIAFSSEPPVVEFML